MAVFQDNLDLMEQNADLLVSLGGYARFLLCADMGRADNSMRDRLLSPRQTLRFFDEVQRISSKYPGRVNAITPFAFNPIGTALRVGKCEAEKNVGLLPDGSISTCGIGVTNAQAVLGNIRTQDLLDVATNSPVFCLLRDLPQTGFKGVCSICMFKSVCANTCPAQAFEIYGSFDGPYPACQQLYEAGLFPKDFIIESAE